MIDPEALRLEALTRVDDERARHALERARVRVVPSALRWEGTLGEVQGVEVELGVAAARLAALEEHPSSVDALEVALARALSSHTGHCLTTLRLVVADETVASWQAYRRPGG